MCIPAARRVMKSLNETQQECKHNWAKDDAWGSLRVGQEQGTSLKLSKLFFSRRSEIIFLELKSSWKMKVKSGRRNVWYRAMRVLYGRVSVARIEPAPEILATDATVKVLWTSGVYPARLDRG